MLQEHVERLYLPAVAEYRRRIADGGRVAAVLCAWEDRLRRGWLRLHIGEPSASQSGNSWLVSVPVYLGDIAADDIGVELYAEPNAGCAATVAMERRFPAPGSINGFVYEAGISAARDWRDYTVRIIPAHAGVRAPAELPLILWQK